MVVEKIIGIVIYDDDLEVGIVFVQGVVQRFKVGDMQLVIFKNSVFEFVIKGMVE